MGSESLSHTAASWLETAIYFEEFFRSSLAANEMVAKRVNLMSVEDRWEAFCVWVNWVIGKGVEINNGAGARAEAVLVGHFVGAKKEHIDELMKIKISDVIVERRVFVYGFGEFWRMTSPDNGGMSYQRNAKLHYTCSPQSRNTSPVVLISLIHFNMDIEGANISSS